MSSDPRKLVADNQIFLMMGADEEIGDAQCAIVLARDAEEARRAFTRTYRGLLPMSWPSLRDIKLSVEMIETAQCGGFPRDVMVINEIG
jgi:hypothetical protein